MHRLRHRWPTNEVFLWQGWRFRTTTADLERLWAKIPEGIRVTVIMEPARNAWAPLAAWLEARAARRNRTQPERTSRRKKESTKAAPAADPSSITEPTQKAA